MKSVLLPGVALLALATPLHAQRTDDNATRQATDAFGTSVGNERVGLYNPFSVRGFSPVDAGNVRLEGLYFDQQANPTDRLVDGNRVRVGLSAQSYPFPAPTGVAEYTLRKAGDELLLSPSLSFGPFEGVAAELDVQVPVTATLGVAAGIGFYREQTHFGGTPHFLSMSVAPRWTPSEGVEIIPFWSRIRYSSEEAEPLLFTAGAFLPPKVPREVYYGQDWATAKGETFNYGGVAKVTRRNWSFATGLFRSLVDEEQGFTRLYTGITRAGIGREIVIANPASKFAATSGEVRLSRQFDEGNRRHILNVALRGRERTRRYGGDAVLDLGLVQVGDPRPLPRPAITYGAQSRDTIKQKTAGVAYEMRWISVGEFGAGIQKTDYSKTTVDPAGPQPRLDDSPWLPNATAALYLGKSLVAYAGYTRGLEEAPGAPDIAVNRNDAPPAIRTKQVDAGLRWAVSKDFRLLAGVFDVEKPFFDLDAANRFGRLGTVRHRGVELSASGQPLKNLSLVAGTIFLDAEIDAPAVAAGAIGKVPVATTKRYSVLSLDYRLPDSPLSLDAVMESTGDRIANQANSFVVPPRAVLALGTRYRFKAGGKPALLRAQLSNIFGNYGYGVGGGGLFVYNLPRRLSLNLSADL